MSSDKDIELIDALNLKWPLSFHKKNNKSLQNILSELKKDRIIERGKKKNVQLYWIYSKFNEYCLKQSAFEEAEDYGHKLYLSYLKMSCTKAEITDKSNITKELRKAFNLESYEPPSNYIGENDRLFLLEKCSKKIKIIDDEYFNKIYEKMFKILCDIDIFYFDLLESKNQNKLLYKIINFRLFKTELSKIIKYIDEEYKINIDFNIGNWIQYRRSKKGKERFRMLGAILYICQITRIYSDSFDRAFCILDKRDKIKEFKKKSFDNNYLSIQTNDNNYLLIKTKKKKEK